MKERVPWQGAWPLFRRFWPYLSGEKRAAALAGALLLLSLPSGAIAPFLVRYLFDEVLKTEPVDLRRLLLVCGLMIGLSLFSAALHYLQSLLSIGIQNRVRFRVMRKLFDQVLRLPLAYFHKTETGYLMSRVRDDVRSLDPIMIDALAEIGVKVGQAVLFLVLLLFLDFGLALSGLILIGAILGLILAVSPALRRLSEKAREADAKSSEALHQPLAGIAAVRTSAQEAQERRRFSAALKESLRAMARREVLGNLSGTAFSLIGVLGVYVIVSVGAYRISAGLSTFGNLFAFFMLLMQLMSATGSIFGVVPGVQAALASLQRIYRVFDEEREREGPDASPPAAPLRGAVEFRELSFRYGAEGPAALQELSLAVRPGEIIGLVGRSGAGKSTLVSLLPRLFDPTSGAVLLDGRPLDSYPLAWLRRRIGVVPQDVFLFNRSIRDNIAYAQPRAGEEQLRAAARAAHAEEFILRLPQGYDTLVGERGVRLSGGEKQRIAIARELLRDPPLLILDEATSSLDIESEALVRDATRRLMQNRTCFVIAHRLSTIQSVDRIVVLDRGRLVAQGSHEQLIAAGGLYRELYELQFQNEAAAGEGGVSPS